MTHRDDKDVLIYFNDDTEAKSRDLAISYANVGIDALCKIMPLKAMEKPIYERASIIWNKADDALVNGRIWLKQHMMLKSYTPFRFTFKEQVFEASLDSSSILDKHFEIKKGTIVIDKFE